MDYDVEKGGFDCEDYVLVVLMNERKNNLINRNPYYNQQQESKQKNSHLLNTKWFRFLYVLLREQEQQKYHKSYDQNDLHFIVVHIFVTNFHKREFYIVYNTFGIEPAEKAFVVRKLILKVFYLTVHYVTCDFKLWRYFY